MLSLPDELNEVLTPDLSKADVQAIKAEVDEEKKVSDIELYLEQQQEPQEQEKHCWERRSRSFSMMILNYMERSTTLSTQTIE